VGNRWSQWRGDTLGNEAGYGAIQDEETWDHQALEDREVTFPICFGFNLSEKQKSVLAIWIEANGSSYHH